MSGPVPRGAFRGRAPPNHCLCPPNENCAPPRENCALKKLTGLVLLECNSRPATPKILVITPKFVSSNCFFEDFAVNIVWFSGPHKNSSKFAYIFEENLCFFFGLHVRCREKNWRRSPEFVVKLRSF